MTDFCTFVKQNVTWTPINTIFKNLALLEEAKIPLITMVDMEF